MQNWSTANEIRKLVAPGHVTKTPKTPQGVTHLSLLTC